MISGMTLEKLEKQEAEDRAFVVAAGGDAECGACAEVAFTGVSLALHTCPGRDGDELVMSHGEPVAVACADLGSHVVDFWRPEGEEGVWACGNDDRSVVGRGDTQDEALNAYLFGLDAARHLLA